MSTQLEKLQELLYAHREGALTCYDHQPTSTRRVWCCACGEHEIEKPHRLHMAEALLEAGVSITDRDTPSVLRSPCCGETVFIKNGWDGGDASAECHCGSEWDEGGEPTYWLSKVCTFDSVRKPA